ncbi:MAG TPA: signal peptide peptidase SppA [Myxococcota bacterium]|nr:signal peptide peptidase SppA [Myxococcota bacterium]
MGGGGFVRRLAANAARAARQGFARRHLSRDGGLWLDVRIGPGLQELRPTALPFAPPGGAGLLDLLRTLQCAAEDGRVDGVLLRFEGAAPGLSQVLALRRAVEAIRASGKPVAAYADALGIAEYWIASAASSIWLPESGALFLVGLRAESTFVRSLLERFAIEPEILRLGAYKSAAEPFTREGMSPEQREQLEALLDDFYTGLVEAIAKGRGLAPEAVRSRIDAGPYHAVAAREAGLIDRSLYPDEIEDALATLTPGRAADDKRPVRLAPAASYLALRAADVGWRPLLSDLPRIAYVVASGLIRRGSGARGIGSDAFRTLLERLAKDDGVRGIVLRVNSPGGDGLASDLLWRAVRKARQKKPVVVSMGDVAASGGYYVACGADAVFAEATTVTGSIGVVGGKVNLSELYRRVGISKEAVERGARAGMLSESRAFTADERAALRGELAHVYDTFVRRVAEGRGIEPAQVERAAGGRVWSGLRAQALGLVDAIGGPLEALREARRRAGLVEGQRWLLEQHPRRARLPGLRALVALALGLPLDPR